MGKKARIKAQRLAEQRGAKSILEEMAALDAEIAGLGVEIENLQASKKAFMEAKFLHEGNTGYTLADFLNDAQVQAVVDILNRPNLDDIAQTKLLKQYLATIKPQLEAKGMNPDYLAYVITYMADQIREQARHTNEPHKNDPLGPMSRQ